MLRRTLRAAAAVATLAPLLALRSSDLPPQVMPLLGGSGGSAFSRDCGAGHVLTGVRYRSGAVVDAIGLQCRTVLSDGSLGPESISGTLAGGSGGTPAAVSCPGGMVATGLRVQFGSYVSYAILSCSVWRRSTRTYAPTVTAAVSLGYVLTPSSATIDEPCGTSVQPASGLRGRAAGFVDALGLVCDEP